MTIWDLGVAMGRRWSVVMVGLVCTALAVVLAGHHQGVYWSRTQVVFLAPSSSLYPNSLKTVSDDIIMTAGVVAKRVNGTTVMPKMASPDVTLFGRGITDGYSVLLPDTGGQWAPDFAQQMLEVQVVGPTVDDVRQRRQMLVDRISEALTTLQDDAGVAEVNRITVKLVPDGSDIRYVAGQPLRAAAMTALLGEAVVIGLVGLLEVRARRREQQRSGLGDDDDSPGDPRGFDEQTYSQGGPPAPTSTSSNYPVRV